MRICHFSFTGPVAAIFFCNKIDSGVASHIIIVFVFFRSSGKINKGVLEIILSADRFKHISIEFYKLCQCSDSIMICFPCRFIPDNGLDAYFITGTDCNKPVCILSSIRWINSLSACDICCTDNSHRAISIITLYYIAGCFQCVTCLVI